MFFKMPITGDLKKVMVIGSGPIIIGQAAEFDYAGTQGCRALREEGVEVVLVNSNPATIMTDPDTADSVYIEPLRHDFIKEIIKREKPCGLLPTLGGQTGLNLAVELADSGVLDEFGIQLLGTSLETIKQAEDRESFRRLLEKINEPAILSSTVETVKEALRAAEKIGYPAIVRPAYTLGGTGGGMVNNPEELEKIAARGLRASPISQVLIEKSLLGWKEIEFEVMRDSIDTCITVCAMENVDAVGIHTGDSIVVAPPQTLSDVEYQMLRTAALKIVRELKVEGGCNVQFALDTQSLSYYVIEVNPRVSRSSALASKATGYPIARVAAKIGLGMTLDEVENAVTKKTSACFEPVIDYVVTKIPRWPFDKFVKGERRLGTQMKATGEVMAAGGSFEESFLKALRSIDGNKTFFEFTEFEDLSYNELIDAIKKADDRRIYALYEGLNRNISIEELSRMSLVDKFFLNKLNRIKSMENELKKTDGAPSYKVINKALEMGFTKKDIAKICSFKVEESFKSHRVYKMVDTCAGEFEAQTPYYYSTYGVENEAIITEKKKVIVIGSGPIRIGQGIEFDYCNVHCVKTLRKCGIDAIIINNNPETVSTDFDISDRLYFEPLMEEDVLSVIEHEKPEGVIVQFGGQTALNLVKHLDASGVKILGTHPDNIDKAEDREKFSKFLETLSIPAPKGICVRSVEQGIAAGKAIGYPLLLRPSYVLGGRAMEIVLNEDNLKNYMESAVHVSPE